MIWPFNIFWVSRKQYNKLQRENIDLEYQVFSARLRAQDAYNDAKLAEMRMQEQARSRPRATFDDDTLRKLISLCHPDRHDGKKSAQEMTAMLIEMRNASR